MYNIIILALRICDEAIRHICGCKYNPHSVPLGICDYL